LVHVQDVERSVAVYEYLGFLATSVFEYRDRLTWAALESDAAELMVTLEDEAIDPQRQGVLFYLYSHDPPALREQLISRDIQAGEIVHGTPGPSAEMRVLDPDGYVLMIAQIDPSE
jgi:hypothetical protein